MGAEPVDEVPDRGSRSAQERDEAARLRDEAAALRDEVAELRDEVADLRDAEPEGTEGSRSDDPDGAAPPADGVARTADREDRAADDRDGDAADRDREAGDRDRAAEHRDEAARAVERSKDVADVADTRSRADAVTARRDAAADRRGAEQDRRRAAHERTAAGLDRDASAGDREHSELDRGGSADDRVEAMAEIDAASLDALTDTYARGPGMAELERDRSRAERTGEPMALAFVDVDDLKGTNDREGHPAGDRMLRRVADVLRACTRPHDVIMRYGGDEFVCGLVGLTRSEAVERLSEANATLATAPDPASITVGVAQLEAGESLDGLVGRADDALYRERRER